jgi:hypothetical protein
LKNIWCYKIDELEEENELKNAKFHEEKNSYLGCNFL